MVSDLPHIDEHATAIETGAERVWQALGEVLASAFAGGGTRTVGRILGVRPLQPSGDPLTRGAALCGFRVVAAEPALELALEGEHRFSRYALIFRIDPLVEGGRVRLRAETRAVFPANAGRLYRALVIGTRAHVVVVRRLLQATKARAEG